MSNYDYEPNIPKKEIILSWLFVIAFALLMAFSMGGCNTVKGMAKDAYAVAEGIQNEMAGDAARDERPSNWD